jgi:hypothetical protein
MKKINLFAQALINSDELQEKIRRGTDLILLSKKIGYDLTKVEINTGFDKHLKHVFTEIVLKEICSGQVDNELMGKAVKKCKGDKVLAEVKYVDWRLDEMKISTFIPFGAVIFSSIPFLVGCWFVSMMIGFINSGIMTIKSEAKSGGTTIYYSESPIVFIINIGFVGFAALLMFWATIWALKRVFKYWSWRKITNV